MSNAHAKLSPSAAYRWMACPASIAETQTVPYVMPRDTSAALLGSEVHAAVEKRFYTKAHEEGDRAIEKMKEKLYLVGSVEEVQLVSNAADDFVEYVESLQLDKVYSEKVVWIKEQNDCWGTADIVGIKDNELYIVDLKYGMYPVSAERNPQLLIYACGALDTLENVEHVSKINMIIYQPRLKNIDVYSVTRDELLRWKETILLPSAKEALGDEALYTVGGHCRYCPAKHTCNVRNEMMLSQIVSDELVYNRTTRKTEKLEIIDDIMKRHADLEKFLKEIKEYAHYAMTQGHEFESVKLVDGRKMRYIADADGLREKLVELGHTEADYMEMKSVAQLERIVGKDVVQFYIEERAGAPMMKRR